MTERPVVLAPSSRQAAGASVEAALAVPGEALDTGVQEQLGHQFGYDFGRVRVQTDAVAAASARDLNAQAYTVGQEIVFGAGMYAPHSGEGQRLIAHELAHVVQQSTGAAPPTPATRPLQVSRPSEPLEHAADRAADQALSGARKGGAFNPSLPALLAAPAPAAPPTVLRKAAAPESAEEALAQVQQEVGDDEAEREGAAVEMPAAEPAVQDPGDALPAAPAEPVEVAAPAPSEANQEAAPPVIVPAGLTVPEAAPATAQPPAPVSSPSLKPEALATTPVAPPPAISEVPATGSPAPTAEPPATAAATERAEPPGLTDASSATAEPPASAADGETPEAITAESAIASEAPSGAPATAAERVVAPEAEAESAAAPSPRRAATPIAEAGSATTSGTEQAAAPDTETPSVTGEPRTTANVEAATAETAGSTAPRSATPQTDEAAQPTAETSAAASAETSATAAPRAAESAETSAAASAETSATAAPRAAENATPAQAAAPGQAATQTTTAAAGAAPTSTPAAGGTGQSGSNATAEAATGSQGSPTSPAEDPAFQGVVARGRATAAQQQAHEPSGTAATRAQAAADPGGADVTMAAQERQVGAIQSQPPGVFDAARFKAALLEKITKAAPKNLKEAEEFKSNNRLSTVKGEVAGQVGQEQQHAAGPVEERAAQPPDRSGIAPKNVQPLQGAEAPPATPPLGGAAAAPKAKTDGEVAAPLQAGSQALDAQMAGASVSEEQLAQSNEPSFNQALEAKRGAQRDAAEAPGRFRQQEQGVLATAQGEAAATAEQQAGAMRQQRAALLAQVFGIQGQAKTGDEAERRKVAEHIASLYEKTKGDVERILGDLEGWVGGEFDKGAEAATRSCVDYVSDKIFWFKVNRYLSIPIVGAARWLEDQYKGLPKEADQFYEEGRKRYIAAMDAVITRIADHVAAELNRAKARVAEGRQQIQQYIATLSPALQQVGQQAAGQIQGKFDELTQSIEDKQGELVDTLAQKYQEKLEAVNGELDKIRQQNSGLVNLAKQLLADTIGKILELKAALESMLAQAAGAVGLILKDPIGFLGNLLSGVKQGFMGFVDRIGTHLQDGLIGWLTGAVAAGGIRVPAKLDLLGIFDLVLQILGLTVDQLKAQLRAAVVKALGRRGEQIVGALEKAWEIFTILQSEGLPGLWRFVQDKIGDLYGMVMGQIQELIASQVIQAGIRWVVGLLGGPAGAFIKAVESIIKVVMWFVENAQRLAGLVSAIFSSVSAIASGNLGQAARYIEGVLAKSIPMLIGFLANLLGLGNIGDKVRDIINKVRAPITKAIQWLIGKAVALGRKMLNALGRLFGRGRPGQAGASAGSETTADKERRWNAGVTAIRALDDQSNEEIGPSLAGIKRQYGFDELRPIEAGDRWRVHAVMRTPKQGDVEIAKEEDESEKTVDISSFGPRPQFNQRVRTELAVSSGLHRRHIVAYETLETRLKQTLNGKMVKDAARILRTMGFPVEPPLTEQKILQRGREYLIQQNNDTGNLWVGSGSENSSLGSSMRHAKEDMERAIETGDETLLEDAIQRYEETAYDPQLGAPPLSAGRRNVITQVVKKNRQRFRRRDETRLPNLGRKQRA